MILPQFLIPVLYSLFPARDGGEVSVDEEDADATE